MLRGFLCASTSSFSFSTLAPFNSATCRENIWKTDFKTLPVQKESFQKYQIIYYLPKLTCSLFLMKMKVGMAVILYSAATSSMSSTSTWHRSYTINQTDNEAVRLTKLQLQLLNFKMEKTLMKTTSSSVLFNSSRTGAIILHGPHLKALYNSSYWGSKKLLQYQVAKKSTTTNFSPAAASWKQLRWNWPQI